MTGVLIGVGNIYRRDDGVGPAVARALERSAPPGWRVVESSGEPTELLDAWASATTALTVDSIVCEPSRPGTVHRFEPGALPAASAGPASSHGLGLAEALRLAAVLGRLPHRHLVYAIEIADTSVGEGFSPDVAAAIPALLDVLRAEMAAGLASDGIVRTGGA
ncbi:hydrogenase maturation protease [Gordonia sp. NPDC003424]